MSKLIGLALLGIGTALIVPAVFGEMVLTTVGVIISLGLLGGGVALVVG